MRVTLRIRSAMSGDANSSHLSDKSALWKKIREALVVNPDSGTGAPLPLEHRYPQPASREEPYTMPSSKASDIAQNPYSQRDFRRMYPSTVALTQEGLTNLLLAQGNSESGIASLPLPNLPSPSSTSSTSVISTTDSAIVPTLASLYALAPSSSSPIKSFRPPTPPGAKYKWSVAKEAIPHNEEAEFPMWSASAELIES